MTVARAVEHHCPGYPFLYFGDIARAPYGPKSTDTIRRYAVDNTRFLVNRGAKLIVIACNSAASTALQTLRDTFSLPIIDVVTPAVNQAVLSSDSGRIGVIGTRATINSGIYEREINRLRPDARVFSLACPLLVPLVEEGWLHKRETKMILRRYLHPLRTRQVDTLVLGCTHYPLLKHMIGPRIGRRVRLIDSSLATAQKIKDFFEQHPDLASRFHNPEQTSRFFVSDHTDTAAALACKIFRRSIHLERIDET